MDRRIAIVVLFSLFVAASASYFVYAMLVRNMGPGTQVSGVRVVIAARDLPLGSVIHETDLTVTEVQTPPMGSLVAKEEVIGRGVTNGIFKGEPILDARLSPKGAGGGLAGLIRPGMRAAAVRVNEVVGVSGFVRPGMHVDVITLGSPPDSNQRNLGTVSRIVLQNLEVISAGQDLEHDAEGKPLTVQVVNLLVTPEEAETLTLASEAKVQLILRSPLDTKIARTPGANTAAMFGSPQTPTATVIARSFRPAPRALIPFAPAPVPQPVTVEVVNGSKKEILTLDYRSPAVAPLPAAAYHGVAQ